MKRSRLKTARIRALVVQIEGGVDEGKKKACGRRRLVRLLRWENSWSKKRRRGLRTKKRSRLREIDGDREGKGVAWWLPGYGCSSVERKIEGKIDLRFSMSQFSNPKG